MRGDITKLLAYEATVKPEIKKLVDNLPNMTLEDIDNAQVPLPWYRDAMKRIKAQQAHAAWMANIDEYVTDGSVNDPMGWTATWDADKVSINLDRGSVDVEFNTVVWFPDSGGVWIETIFSNKIDPLLNNLRRTQYLSKSQYYTEYRKRINNLNPTSTIDLTNGTTEKPRFTIQRH